MSSRAVALQPPLAPWQQAWRFLAAVSLSAAIAFEVWPPLWDINPAWVFADLTLGIAGFVLMAFRRRWPVAVAATLAVFGGFSTTAAGPGVVALVSLATHRQWRQILPVGVLVLAMGLVYSVVLPDTATEPWFVSAAFNLVFTAVMIASGMYIGARRELVATLQDRADRAEREQALRVTQAKSQERARIAREMHDVLAHRISLVAMHAGALTYRTDLGAEQTRRTAEIVQTNAHQALTDLREVLGLLRRSTAADDGDPERPQPTLRDVPELVAEARAAGMRVTLTDEVRTPDRIPDTLGRNAYRMIQEGLTNARKHAPNTLVEIRLQGAPDEGLQVEVRNPLPLAAIATAPVSGLGLVGLTERAELSGGRLEHETTSDRQFVIRAWLPWPA